MERAKHDGETGDSGAVEKVPPKKKDALGNVTIFGYNLSEEPNLVVDAEGSQTMREYNERGLPVKITDANNGVTEFEYDDNGND